MAKKEKPKKSSFSMSDEVDPVYLEIHRHYNVWTEDNDIRMLSKNGWNDITDSYYGRLPADWPYLSKVVDPRIRTSIIEKDARLLNQKLRGRLVPREGGDVLKARLNNALLDFQWDNANHGGSMLEKLNISSQDTRLYASKFGLVTWMYECDKDGKLLFNGNEFTPLDIRDCGLDPTCDHIRNAKWFQHRSWAKIEDLELINDTGTTKEVVYPGLAKLKEKMRERSDRRDNAYTNRILHNKGLTDRVGEDLSFPVVELVTEYRRDRWITFAPKYKVILRDIPNPYKHKKIPIVQLRYYSIQGDPLGESEVQPVLPIWRAIQAVLCGYLDNMNMHIRPPLKILDGKARIETIVYGPEAQWLIDQQDAVMEHKSSGEAIAYFQSTYQALISAFNTAMGDTSMGVSAIDPTTTKRTATEIKKSSQQQLTRDQKNQNSLAEFLTDIMSMWLSNNQQFLFADETQHEYVLRIVGSSMFEYFKRAGLNEMELTDDASMAIADIITMNGGNMSDDDLNAMVEAGKTPKYPVFTNPDEKDPEKLEYKPKMRLNDMGDAAELSLVPDDLEGTYDYIPDIKSMAVSAGEELIQARQNAIARMENPQTLQMLAQEGVRPVFKELYISDMEDSGLKDAERFFQTIDQNQQMGAMGQPQPNQMSMPQNGQPQPQPDINQILAQGDQLIKREPQLQAPMA